MKRFLSLIALLLIVGISQLAAQVVETNPAIVQEDSQNITITFYSSRGSGGMKGSTNCYAHTGVITTKSTSDSDWKYAPSWGDNSEKYKLKLVGTNKFRLTIPDIRSYYGITDPEEKVLKLAFVFRNADCSKEGKNEDGSDIIVNVFASGLAVDITSDATNGIVPASKGTVNFSVATSTAANIKLFLNSTSSTPIASVDNATTLSTSYTFPEGDYSVIAQAVAGDKTVTSETVICSRGESKAATAPNAEKKGVQVNASGDATFYLYAPGKTNVMLIGEWNDYKPTNAQVMSYEGNKYFFTTVKGLDMNKEYAYYFLVDDAITVADPYSKLILDPWSDKYINEKSEIYPNLKPFPNSKVGSFIISLFKGNQDSYNWEVTDFKAPASKDLIIYEILLRDFTESKSLKGAIEKLDYIKSLGVNAIELMPVFEFSGNNSWGYNPSFYFAPDKAYGTPNDYKLFIDECHKRGLAVIVDVVFNHATGDHPWCKMYWDATTNKPLATSPFFNVDAPHNFSVFNDWKLEKEDVKAFFCDVLKYWIKEYKVDGYRFDLAKGLGDSNSYASDYDASNYNSSRLATTTRFTNTIKEANPNAAAIFEYFVSSSEEDALAKVGGLSWNNMNNAGKQYAGGYSSNSSFAGGNNTGRVSYIESHDEERNAFFQSEYGADGVKGNLAASMRRLGSEAALYFLLPGAKMMWQFEEMGYDVSIDEGGRTGEKPLHWEYLEDADRKGLVESYSEILNIRKVLNSTLYNGGEFYVTASVSNWESGRFITARNKTTGVEMAVIVNPTFGSKTFNYTFDNPTGKYYINSKSYNTDPAVDYAAGKVTLPGHSYVVITNKEISGVEENIADGINTSVTIFPNPAADIVYVAADDVKSIEVYSISGQLVAANAGEQSINVSNLATGNYIVKIATAKGAFSQKLIKK